jgi:transposase-like protein
MAGTRRAFTDAFKAEAVRLVTVDGHPVSQVAKELDIHDSLLRRWQRKLDARRARGRSEASFGRGGLKLLLSRMRSGGSSARTSACAWNATF